MNVLSYITLVVVAVLAVLFAAPIAHAEKIRQWIAPPECVVDAGLVTEYILTEEQCYELLNPQIPGAPGDGGDGSGSGSGSSGEASKKRLPVVFLPLTSTIPNMPATTLGAQKYTIIIDHAKKPRTGEPLIAVIAAIYAFLLMLILARRFKAKKDEEQ